MVAALSIFVIVDCWWSASSSSTFSLSCVVYEGFSSIDIRLSPAKVFISLKSDYIHSADHKLAVLQPVNHFKGGQNNLYALCIVAAYF